MNEWMEQVSKYRKEIIEDTQNFLRIKSVLDESEASVTAPFGNGINEALEFLLKKGSSEGFQVKNVDGYAGHIEMGQGEEIVGILCHVDVVPEGDGWTSDPFGAEIREGKIFARGAIDDKGPTIAAFYAMKIVKEMNLPLSKRVRMIIGTDEESDWQCVAHYFKHEEMPAVGFAPDADFPIIYAEKGIVDFDLVQNHEVLKEEQESKLISFQSGRRYNMVPDFAEAKMKVAGIHTSFVEQFNEYLSVNGYIGKAILLDTLCILQVEGKSAHAMEPNLGKNAAICLAGFLNQYKWDQKADEFLSFIVSYFSEDSRGKCLGIGFEDDISGALTLNVGKVSYSNHSDGVIGLNMRYPVTNDITKTREQIQKVCEEHSFSLHNFSDSPPHHVAKDHPLIQTLQKVYVEQTGQDADLISIGGGTYARSLKNGVAFGPLFPGREDVAHQKDEHIFIDDLLKATAIYAQAISELAK
ncbi:dipeptidase PepV [Litchfieldia salsa]|uniref:Succinyl-diaminopimelate desuccinylase n=1 Tax=Litchfieldia salsa TaxID=930152 RepID=A0A1H0PA08_9BACI|nr:dipeptidase PepV [Litchfieldia salsa]SDP01590.1 succinyl-diaminopimelate desuccinylase [Litchfieldia salsa]